MRYSFKYCAFYIIIYSIIFSLLPAKAEASSPSLFFDAKLGADYRQGTYGEDIEKRGLSPFGQASFAFDAGSSVFLDQFPPIPMASMLLFLRIAQQEPWGISPY